MYCQDHKEAGVIPSWFWEKGKGTPWAGSQSVAGLAHTTNAHSQTYAQIKEARKAPGKPSGSNIGPFIALAIFLKNILIFKYYYFSKHVSY